MRVSAGLLFAGVALAAGCKGDSLGPGAPKPPYIAIVSKIETGALPDPNLEFRYRIKDVSADGVLDTVIVAAPTDTIILSVRPASYEIKLENVPAKCVSRYGAVQDIQVPEGINTAIARYFISCNLPLAATIVTLGGPDQFQFVWELKGADGSQRTGLVEAREQVEIFNPLPPGPYTFSIYSLPPPCEVTSRGRRSQDVTVTAAGGALLEFAVICSQPPNRPVLTDFQWSYHDSAAVFVARVSDPDRNVLGYYFDITDCAGRSILPGGERERGGLQTWHTARTPTPVIIGAFELGEPDATYQGRCGSIRVVDADGNTTPFLEKLQLNPGTRHAPTARQYNAVFAGDTRMTTVLDPTDEDDDYLGAFVAVRLRDGVLGTPDGKPDLGVYNNQGFIDTQIPDLPLGSRFSYADVYGQIVYLVDQRGLFRRLVDADPFK